MLIGKFAKKDFANEKPPMSKRHRLFAGAQLRRLRARRQLRQGELARQLGISASYLSQLEHDDRPLTPRLIAQIARLFPLDWQEFAGEDAEQLSLALREAVSDPLFDAPCRLMRSRVWPAAPGFRAAFC
jgi:transcriptional regulator with XRE-family HTH domain